MMKMGRTLVLTLSCLTAYLPGYADAGETVVLPSKPLVELFTSQGCNSCPPADAFMAELADRNDLIALTWSVDYWDYLGWQDTFARPENTGRQRGYNRALGLSGLYTPQMVFDGRLQAVGSRREEALAIINNRLTGQGSSVSLSLARNGAGIATLTITGKTTAPAAVWLIEFSDRAHQEIEGGELKGSAFTYRHVVRSAEKVGQWTGGSQAFPLAALAKDLPSGNSRAIIVQTGETGPVLAAADLP